MSTHIGRSWPGMGNPLEQACPCSKEPCGLVDREKIDPECGQHPVWLAKTMRQSHYAGECPGRPNMDGPRRVTMVVGRDGQLYEMTPEGDPGTRVESMMFGGLTFNVYCFPELRPGDMLQRTDDGRRWEFSRVRWSWWRQRAICRVLVSGRHPKRQQDWL